MATQTIKQILANMPYEYRMNILAELKELQAGKIKIPGYGICGNLQSDEADWFPDIAQYWPDHSGNPVFPIPGGSYSYTTHRSNGSLWTGKQLEYRQSLIAFAITALEDF